MSMPYKLQRALARLGLMKKPAVPTTPGGPHLRALAMAVSLSAKMERQAAQGRELSNAHVVYLDGLDAAAALLGELAKAAAAGDARR